MKSDFSLADWKNRAWAMEPRALSNFFFRVAALNPDIFAKKGATLRGSADKSSRFVVENGIAKIPVRGYLLDKVPGWIKELGEFFGIEVTAYSEILRDLNTAIEDEGVKEIQLDINSPGGIVGGVHNVASAIFAANKTKKITAVVDSLAASAAYWLASQADEIVALGPTAEIGSIGVYMVIEDFSKFYETAGVKVNVLRSGPYKGTGVEGAPVTDAELEPFQEAIDGLVEIFVHDISRGRDMLLADAQKLASGRTWLAEEALGLGLIDKVGMGPAEGDVKIEPPQGVAAVSVGGFELKGDEMDAEKKAETAAPDVDAIKAQAEADGRKAEQARLDGLLAAFPEDSGFAVKQFQAGATVEAAKSAYADVLKEKLAAKDVELAKKDAELAKNAAAAKGAEPLETDGVEAKASTSGLRPDEELKQLARARATEKKISYAAAASEIVKERPELYSKLLPTTVR